MRDKTDLYRHFDENGDLLYVGISINVLTRTQQHRCEANWFDQVRNITIEKFDTTEAALIAEKSAIKMEYPIYNVAYAYSPNLGQMGHDRVIHYLSKDTVGPQLPYTGRQYGYVVGDVPYDFPADEDMTYEADTIAANRIALICHSDDTVHVYAAVFPEQCARDLTANGVRIIHHATRQQNELIKISSLRQINREWRKAYPSPIEETF